MYRFLDHPSEALVEVEATVPEAVFRDAAVALFEIMTDTSRIKPVRKFPVSLSAREPHLLLIDWLNRLIFLHEVERVFLSSFDVAITAGAEGWELSALAAGEEIQESHEKRSHAKSATYGQLEWNRTPSGYHARFVVDI